MTDMAPAPPSPRGREDIYATLNLAMDHALGAMSSAATPLPPSLHLRHGGHALVDTWSELQACVETRRTMIASRKQQRRTDKLEKLEKRKAKQPAARAKLERTNSNSSITSNTSTSSTKPPQPSPSNNNNTSSFLSVKSTPKTQSISVRAHAQPLGTSRKSSSTPTKQPSQSSSSALKRRDADVARPALPSALPLTPPSTKHELPASTDTTLAKLRSLPLLRSLERDSHKFQLLLQWLDADKRNTNAAVAHDVLAFVMDVDRRQARSRSTKHATRGNQQSPKKKRETLDQRLAIERNLKAPVASDRCKRKRQRLTTFVNDDADEEDDDDEDDEDEYNDGGDSDSDEAEATLTLADPSITNLRTRDITGGTKRYATAAKAQAQATGSATAQLQRVVARLKDADADETKDGSLLGASAQRAIVLEESDEYSDDEDEDKDEDEDDDEEEEEIEEEIEDEDDDDEEEQHAPAATSASSSKRLPALDAAIDDASSTDDDEDLFDLNEDDVYVVESILDVKIGRTLPNKHANGSIKTRRNVTKEMDLFLVKWAGYDELTWEPEANIPKRLLDLFQQRELLKRSHRYQITEFLERKDVRNVSTGNTPDVIYLILWVGEDKPMWEAKSALPDQVVVWLEKTSRSSKTTVFSHSSGTGKKKART